jgi:hypothetical protein
MNWPVGEPPKLSGELRLCRPEHRRNLLFKSRQLQPITIALTQTCRQIRLEFLPLHDASFGSDIPAQNIGKNISKYYNVLLRSEWLWIDGSDCEGLVVELLPLMRLSTAAPRVNILGFRGGELAQNLLEIRHVLALKKFVHTSATSMSYRAGSNSALKVVVKESAAAEWMPWDPTVDNEGRPRKERGAATLWRMRAGLGAFPMPFVEVAKQ